MRTSTPPLIAAWILHRFGPMPETETIAGDLSEQYQLGRSRLWYWREVIVAILRGTWSEVQQHSLLLLLALLMAWTLNFIWHWFVTPFQYSLLVRYVLHGQARLQQIEWVGFLLDGPLAMAMGWLAARVAWRCRIPAVICIAGTGLLVGAWTIWKSAQIVWPESLGYHFSIWTSVWPIPLMTILVLLGGGLLTASPKRSTRTH
jgi:hypothetical protein